MGSAIRACHCRGGRGLLEWTASLEAERLTANPAGPITMSGANLRTGTVIDSTDFQFQVQRQDHDCTHILHYQTATADRAVLEAYCYTDRISYEPGATVSI